MQHLRKLLICTYSNWIFTVILYTLQICQIVILYYSSVIFSGDEHITSLCEFPVHKVSHRHNDPVRRTLCVTETCLLERDPNSYAIVTLRPLSDVFALVRDQDNPQKLIVEYVRGGNRVYTSSDRWA